MNTAEHDDRCWHELPFDELAKEAQEIASSAADADLAERVKRLLEHPSSDNAEMVIAQIENFH